MQGCDGRRMHSRIVGRWRLQQRAAGLLRATHRFARGRAVSHDDVLWCARAIDLLTELLNEPGRRPTNLPGSAAETARAMSVHGAGE